MKALTAICISKERAFMGYIEKEYRFIFLTMLINFILFGISFTIIGATLPRIIRSFDWDYIETGFVLSAGSIGYFLSSFISGLALQRLGPKRVIVTGLILQSIGLMLFAINPNVLANLILCLLIGIGQGGTEVVVNFSVVRIERAGKSQLMNLMHAAFSIGAVAGPFADVILMKTGLAWQTIYRIMAVVAIIMAFTSGTLKLARLNREEDKPENRSGVGNLLRSPLLILSFLILLVYVGSELGVSNWISEYYVKYFGMPDRIGSIMVSVFWTGLLIGRLGISIFYRGTHQGMVALVLALICSFSLFVAVFTNIPWLASLGFFCAGLGYSAIYPLTMAIVGKYFKHNQGAAVGFAATGGGVGSFVFPFIMAAISNVFGIHKGFFFYIGLNIFIVFLILAVIWQTQKFQASEAVLETQ